ncbi:hypothetical protein B0H10DRAFT_2135342 [Mycena sp. CBHHK59/15]|nr:hypothetical protein B0H10DRAFT_2135342 [Mycena sp. CBHHK59/15]
MSPPFRVRQLDPCTSLQAADPGSLPDVDEIENVLRRAFTGIDYIPILAGSDDGGPLCKSTVVAGLLGGEVYVVETADAERKVVGCAVWFGPGREAYDTEDKVKLALGPFLATLSKELQQWWGDVFTPQYDHCATTAFGEGTKRNAWHLQTLGVDPGYQHQGAATLLINTIVEKAALANTLLCVECSTETNVEIYTRLGFALMPKDSGARDDCKATCIGVDGSNFPMWFMVREVN